MLFRGVRVEGFLWLEKELEWLGGRKMKLRRS
jgi:hypothetical protein